MDCFLKNAGKILLFILGMVTVTDLWPASAIIARADRVVDMNPYLELTVDPSSSLSIEEILLTEPDQRFKPLNEWKEPFEAEKTYWGKLELENNMENGSFFTEWILNFSIYLTTLEVFVADQSGIIYKSRSGMFTPTRLRTFAPIYKANLVKIKLPPNEKVRIYFRAKSDRPSVAPEFDLTLEHSQVFYETLKNRKAKNTLFIGFVLMMLIYNLILSFYAKDKAYSYYSVYLFSIAIFSAYNTGDLADWIEPYLFPNHPEYFYFFKPITYVALIGYMGFIRSFLDLRQLLPLWDRIFKWMIMVAVPLFFLDIILMILSNFSPNVSDMVTVGYAIAFMITTFFFTVPLYRTDDKKGYFIIAGIIAMGLGVLFTSIDRMRSIDYSTIYVRIGSILDIIAFSLGLAYRQRENERSKQKAHFELEKSKLIHLQEHNEAERLKELNHLKSRLFTNITHEFRTPLTVIMGMTDQIENNEKAKDLIKRNSESLLYLINQMLDLAKLEEGKLKLDLVQDDIIHFLQYLTESFYSAAISKNIRLTFYSEEEELVMDFDESKIQQIIQNLLSNALKFTGSFGKVVLHVRKKIIDGKPFLLLKIKDNGEGIATEDMPHIFDRFYQADNSDTRNTTGTGIGLALTKELVTLLGGKIEAKSKVGKGSEFVVKLPISYTAAPKKPSFPGPQIMGEVPVIYELHDSPDNALSEEYNRDLPLILVIEDNPDVIEYIKTLLEADHQMMIATNGRMGIEQALKFVPDIILCDVMMPEIGGFEVAGTLKEDERTSHIPIILITAKATEADKIEGLRHGADAYLTKPFNKEELLVRIEKLLEVRKQMQLKYSKRTFGSSFKAFTEIEDPFLMKMEKVIRKNLEDANFSMAQLTKAMGLSHTQIYRKLKAMTNQTPTQFIRAIRLEHAMNLLQNTEISISQIAYKVGFNDPNYFTRTFQQEYGKTPSAVRE